MTLSTKQRKSYTEAGGSKLDAFLMPPDAIWIVGLDYDEEGEDPFDSEDQPVREHPLYDERIELPLPKAFVKNVKVNGVKKAINTRVVDGHVCCVDGRQRLRAIRKANELLEAEGLEPMMIPVKPELGGADEEAALNVITANSFSQADSPFRQAQKAQRLLNRGVEKAVIANSMGVSTATLKNYLKLLDAPDDLTKHIDTIGMMAVLHLSDVEDEDERAGLCEELVNDVKETQSRYGIGAKAKKKASKAKSNSKAKGKSAAPKVGLSKSDIKKMMATEAFADLSLDVRKTFAVIIGEVEPDASRIKGLKKVFAELEAEE